MQYQHRGTISAGSDFSNLAARPWWAKLAHRVAYWVPKVNLGGQSSRIWPLCVYFLLCAMLILAYF